MACRNKISCLKSGVKSPFYLRMVTGDRKKTAPSAIGDGKGGRGVGEDNGQVKSGAAVTSDKGTVRQPRRELPLRLPNTPSL